MHKRILTRYCSQTSFAYSCVFRWNCIKVEYVFPHTRANFACILQRTLVFFCFCRTRNYNSASCLAAHEDRRAIGLIPTRRVARMLLLFLSFPVATNGQDNEQRERRRKTNSDLFVHYAGIFSQWSNRSCTTIRTQFPIW